jgi:hypothetical protein
MNSEKRSSFKNERIAVSKIASKFKRLILGENFRGSFNHRDEKRSSLKLQLITVTDIKRNYSLKS